MDPNFLKVAKQAAIEAGEIISKYSNKTYKFNSKDDDTSDFVTEADLEAEKIIIKILTDNFPGHNIITEEQAVKSLGSDYTWVIDPLDGTFSFIHNFPSFCVSIGLLKDNQPIFALIYQVQTKKLYWAEKGKGAYLNDTLIHVSRRKTLADSAVVLDFNHRKRRPPKLDLYILPLINKVGYPYSVGSTVAVLGLIAEGIFDATVNEGWVWDFAAGALIVEEAGGTVTDISGQPLDWTKKRFNIIASNSLVHEEILEGLKK